MLSLIRESLKEEIEVELDFETDFKLDCIVGIIKFLNCFQYKPNTYFYHGLHCRNHKILELFQYKPHTYFYHVLPGIYYLPKAMMSAFILVKRPRCIV